MSTFTMDPAGLKKLDRFFKGFPNEAKKATAGILNSLAFQARKYQIESISANMVIRNRRFIESSLRVETTRALPINQQVAYAGSINRPRFTGWEEQQTGKPPKRKRSITLHARGGSKAGQVRRKARLRSGNKFYKPEQFQGKNIKQRFQFMMRVLGSRGGGEFLLTQNIPTKRGHLKRGLYSLKKHKIIKLQDFDKEYKIRRLPWATMAMTKLHRRNDIKRIWGQQLQRAVDKYRR